MQIFKAIYLSSFWRLVQYNLPNISILERLWISAQSIIGKTGFFLALALASSLRKEKLNSNPFFFAHNWGIWEIHTQCNILGLLCTVELVWFGWVVFLWHRLFNANQVLLVWVKVNLGVMAMKKNSTLPKFPWLEPHHNRQFCVTPRKLSPVGWGCRIHWLDLCPRYDTKQSDGEAPVMLELWGMWRTPSLPSLQGTV